MKLGSMLVLLIGMMIVLEFVGLPTGLSVTLNSVGIEINQNTSNLIQADIANSSFWGKLFGTAGVLTLLIGGGAVIVGLFAKSYDTSLIILPFVLFVGTTFIGTFGAIILFAKSLGQDWIIALVATIFLPLAVAFIMSCSDYFAGR